MDFPVSKIFHQASKVKKGENQPKIIPFENWPREWKEIEFKQYPRFERIILPKSDLPKVDLQKAIIERCSQRDFSEKPVRKEDLARLLFWSAGLIKNQENNLHKSRRPYPSAGARYPLEVYLAVLAGSEEIKAGLYHYNLVEHCLENLLEGGFREELMAAIGQEMIGKTPLILMISTVFKRTQIKYKERGYRFVLMEAGHLGQNISLISATIGLKCCAIGGFDDDICNRLLDLNDEEESVIYFFAIGY